VLITSLIELAKIVLQRRRETRSLRKLERHHRDLIEFHAYQAHLAASQAPLDGCQDPHTLMLLVHQARLRRVRDEQTMLKTGKGFWQLYDIDETARYMRDLERRRAPNLLFEWEAIPMAAIPALHQRMTEMGRDEVRARIESAFGLMAALRPEEFWWADPKQGPAVRFI
jgi:hypothetical protein